MFLYMLCFGASWGPVPWAMPSEIFPSSIRGKGVAFATTSNWLNSKSFKNYHARQMLTLLDFIIGLITPPMISGTRGFGAYTFFAVFCGLSAVWTWFLVPETKGRSLEDMDRVFGDK